MKRKKTRRQKNEETKRRFEAIKDMMSTFAMSTVAVVATVTLIPASPKAEITKSVALSEEIIYQVNVTDEDNALDKSTLFVVLENQLVYYEEPITLGESSGYFDELEEDTQYRLSVYGNKGFGQERLDTVMLTTRGKVGGTILSVTPDDAGHHGSTYTVDVSIYDPDMKYSSITLYYGYSWEPDQEITYTAIPVTTNREEIILADIWTEYPFHIYLEGTTTDGTELLDEIWVTPPYSFFGEAYLAYFNSTEIKYHLYGDDVEDLRYQFNVYQHNLLIKSEIFIPDPEEWHPAYLIEGLTPESIYTIEVVAIFTNPNTLSEEKMIILTEEVTTTEKFTYDYTYEIFDDRIEVEVHLYDGNYNIFNNVFYEIYDTSGEEEIIVDIVSVGMNFLHEEKEAFFTIDLAGLESYSVLIGFSHQTENHKKMIDTIYSE